MALIAFNSDFMDVGTAEPFALDIEAGGDNWIAATLDIDGVAGIYVPGTEFGGPLEKIRTQTGSTLIKYEGHTWRGLLTQKVLEPPSGADYYTTDAGDANTVLAAIIGDSFGGVIAASQETAGITIAAHQYSRYCTMLEGIEEICEENGLRLNLAMERTNGVLSCTASLAAAQTLDAVYGEDSRIKMTWTEDNTGINHLICLGSGQLAERNVLHLYADGSGTISTTQTYTGYQERAAVYDYGSIENDADLEKEGRKRFRELLGCKKLDVTEIPSGYNIGDKVTARRGEADTTAPIDRAILKYKNGHYTAEYRVKEDT